MDKFRRTGICQEQQIKLLYFGDPRNDENLIVSQLHHALPGIPVGFMSHLAQRNLQRSVALRVPVGQAIANRIGIAKLTSEELLSGVADLERNALNSADLLNKTPLWYYILKEAEVKENGERVGQLGSIIVAKTFIRILRENQDSILNAPFQPSLPRHNGRPAGDFDMADLLSLAGVLS